MYLGSSDNIPILLARGKIFMKELQMIFQTSDVSIYNGSIKDPNWNIIFYTKITFNHFHVSLVANIGSLKYDL